MQQAVVGGQAIPVLPHHPPGPDGAVGVHHGARLPRGAGGEDQVSKPVRIAQMPGAGRQVAPGLEPRGGDHRCAMVGQGNAGRADDQRRVDLRGHGGDFGRRQLCRTRHRHKSRGQRPQEGQREVDRIAQAQQHTVARLQALVQQPGANAAQGGGQGAKGPTLGPGDTQHLKRDLVGRALARSHHIPRQVERRGAGGGWAVIS